MYIYIYIYIYYKKYVHVLISCNFPLKHIQVAFSCKVACLTVSVSSPFC